MEMILVPRPPYSGRSQLISINGKLVWQRLNCCQNDGNENCKCKKENKEKKKETKEEKKNKVEKMEK